MSNQTTNVDIDDVLSSIRRLVSEGDKKSHNPSGEVVAPDLGPEKLILTPNFRVKDSDAVPEEAAPSTEEQGEVTPAEAPPPQLVLTPELSVPAEPLEIGSNNDSLEAKIAVLEARLTDQDPEWEPDGSEITTEPTWDSAGFSAKPRETQGQKFSEETIEAAIDATIDATSAEDQLLAAAFDAAFSSNSEAEEPEETFVAKSREHRWTKVVEPRFAPPVAEPETDFNDELSAGTGPDDALERYLNQPPAVDEAALKQMVQEVIREELQGKLGERITRNVRKLVRKEIHNILTTQEFD